MADLPYCPMYWRDLLTDTNDLSAEEFGAYTRILGRMWLAPKCALDPDPTKLARVAGIPSRRFKATIWPAISDLFRPAYPDQRPGFITQKRMREEWDKVSAMSQRQAARRAGKSAGNDDRNPGNDLKTEQKIEQPKPLKTRNTGPTAVNPGNDLNKGKGSNGVHNLFSSEPSSPGEGKPGSPAPKLTAEIMIAIWRRVCVPAGLADVQVLSEARRAKCRTRIRDTYADPAKFEEACRAIAGSTFCTGQNDRGWRATFDFVIKDQNTAARILEGAYADKAPHKTGPDRPSPTFQGGYFVD